MNKRRGKESNQPRQGSLTDNGFEDRGAHQVLVSLLFGERQSVEHIMPLVNGDDVG